MKFYFKNSIKKQHCPKCNVPVTDIGTCPYCQTTVNPKYYKKIKAWNSDVNFIDGIIIPYYAPKQVIKKYQIVKMKGFNTETKDFKKADCSFFKQFKLINLILMHKFIGKKEDL